MPQSSSELSSVVVRLARVEERPRARELLRQFHYLGFNGVAGESIFYVATIRDKWVAVLVWTAAALHVRCREDWIGWDHVVQKKRLRFIANNARFLILPEIKIKNLASKILGLNVKRLSSDWQSFYGHPIWLAETFVDPSKYKGTCYRAAGWSEIGRTLGFTRLPRQAGFYIANGNPKLYFARPLIDRPREKLSSPFFEHRGGEFFVMDVSKIPIEDKGGLGA